jgi:hypothetical protein
MNLGIAPGAGQSTPGDLGERVEGDRLLVPADVARSLEGLPVRSAEELIAYLDAFPSALAGALGWQVDDVDRARAGLAEALRGRVDPALLSSEIPFERGMGAFDPRRESR